ncbi:MAG: FG-GAP repeat protein, partial [Acidimicrobiales bacterium]
PQVGARLGAALAVGNVNSDEFEDLIVGVPGEDIGGKAGAGQVHVFLGGSAGLVASASITLHQDTLGVRGEAGAGDAFGSSLAVGDLNADGYGDLVVGVPGDTVGAAAGAGLVNVLFGSATGVDIVGDRLLSQATRRVKGRAETGDHLGASVTTIDINGDGFRDLVIGVPEEDIRAAKNAGHILLVPGRAGGVRLGGSSGMSQKKPAAGANERGDRFGYALAAS